MMGKQAAQKLAREERLTWGELRALVLKIPEDTVKASVVNGSIRLSQVRRIYLEATADHRSDGRPRSVAS